MGCGPVQNKHEEAKNAVSKQIDRDQKQLKKNLARVAKLLLLGSGESGKSTMAKQMRILHLDGFNESDRLKYRDVIKSNIFDCLKNLVEGAKMLGYKLKRANRDFAKEILAVTEEDFLENDINSTAIKTLWSDKAILNAYENRNQFQLLDSCKYFLENITRIAEEDYIPDETDIIFSRAKTTGVFEIEFKIDDVTMKLIDVGGQRSERKKWIQCFTDVTAILFCVAISEYDQVLYEDHTVNRMFESMKIFEEIANYSLFNEKNNDKSIILFFNKRDIFEDKLKTHPITCFGSEYTGGNDYHKATEFISNKFISLVRNTNKTIFTHITNATDTENINFVFSAVFNAVLEKLLSENGLM